MTDGEMIYTNLLISCNLYWHSNLLFLHLIFKVGFIHKTLKNHAKHEYHKLSLLKADGFLNINLQKEPELINRQNEDRYVRLQI